MKPTLPAFAPDVASASGDDMQDILISHTDEVTHVAMQSLFSHLNDICEGAIIVDKRAKIVWLSPKYSLLLGIEDSNSVVGMPAETIIPQSMMRQVVRSGEPILLDIMPFGKESFVVTRMPVKSPDGKVIGAIGFVLYERLHFLKPLVAKFAQFQHALLQTNHKLLHERSAKYSFDQIIGSSAVALEVVRMAKRASSLDSTVLIQGETGTGKELVAHAIHNNSPRANKPFVTVNAAAIPENLLEAEFFGTAPGAYTGADKRGREGKFKLANGGTLFLDEVGDMPLPLQAKLLRVLQEHEFEALGSNQVERIDVRVIAATSLDIEAMVEQGRFRSDLYYRLNVLSVTLPPLRERCSDIPMLCNDLLAQIAEHIGTRKRSITARGMAVLCNYAWPGNVRELRNVLERAVMMSDKIRLDATEICRVLPSHSPHAETGAANSTDDSSPVLPLERIIEDAERSAIQRALVTTNGNKLAAAQLLGISRATLYHKISQLGINV